MRFTFTGHTVPVLALLAMLAAAQLRAVAPVRLNHQGVTDTNYGLTAYYLLIPAGWQLNGQIGYRPAPSLARTSVITARNADDTRGIYMILSENTYTYGQGPVWDMFLQNDRTGIYQGLQVVPPMAADEYLRKMLVPVLRQKNASFMLQEVKPDRQAAEFARRIEMGTPAVQAMVQLGARMEFDAVQFTGRQTVNSNPVELKGSLQITRSAYSSDGMNVSQQWGINRLTVTYAEEGRLEALKTLFQSITRSVRINPAWYIKMQNNRYRLWQQVRDAQAAVGRIMEQTNEAIRNRDRIYEGFSEYIRGTDVYQNPHTGDYYELEGGREHAWFNKSGDVLYSDDPNYSPNTDPRHNNQDWSEGRRQR